MPLILKIRFVPPYSLGQDRYWSVRRISEILWLKHLPWERKLNRCFHQSAWLMAHGIQQTNYNHRPLHRDTPRNHH
jgi:hypothetical protein